MAAVRSATEADLPRLVEMGRKFHEASPWAPVAFVPEDFEQTCRWLMENGILLVSERGMIGAPVFPLFFNGDALAAQELFWWAEDGEGALLRSEMEQRAREVGARIGVMGALETLRPDVIARVLRGVGYRPTERLYMKEL